MKRILWALFICYVSLSLFLNVCIAEETVMPVSNNLIGMKIENIGLTKKAKLPLGYSEAQSRFIMERTNRNGEIIHVAILKFMYVKSYNNHFLWLVRPLKGGHGEIIDAITIDQIRKDQLIKMVPGADNEVIFALINKDDYEVIKAWTVKSKESKIAEIATKGIFCYDDYNPFLFTGCDPKAGEADDKDISAFIGKQNGPETTFPKGVKDIGGHILGNDYWIAYVIYKKSYIALLEKFSHRDASGRHAYFRVLDAIKLPIKNNETWTDSCGEDGQLNIVAIVDKKNYRVHRAWMADVESEKFKKISIKGLTCFDPAP